MALATSRLHPGVFRPPKSPARLSSCFVIMPAMSLIVKCLFQLPVLSKVTPSDLISLTELIQFAPNLYCAGGCGVFTQNTLNFEIAHSWDHLLPYSSSVSNVLETASWFSCGIIESSRYVVHVSDTSPTFAPAPAALS